MTGIPTLALLAAKSLTFQEVIECRTFWGLVLAAVGLWLALPKRVAYGKSIGGVLGIIGLALVASDWPLLPTLTDQAVFWLLAAVTILAAAATITSYSPVYSAIWFALSLLGTGGLFFFNGAQFLGVATIVVYAGAIVVTFLFVIMLAQPEGHSAYDRLTWGGLPKVLGVVTAGLLLGILTFMLGNLKNQAEQAPDETAIAAAQANLQAGGGILADKHVANLGRHLFGEHLINIELAGTLLLVALVGAVAITMHGRPRLAQRIEEALR
jgi:NADH-quinone oxidoreductase subunit J